MIECTTDDEVRKAKIDDYKAGRLFCQFTINVAPDGITIRASKDVRIGYMEQSIVSSAGHVFPGIGKLTYVRLGEGMSTGGIPLRNQHGFVIDYMENYDQAKRTATTIAHQWRNSLIEHLTETAAQFRAATVSIEE